MARLHHPRTLPTRHEAIHQRRQRSRRRNAPGRRHEGHHAQRLQTHRRGRPQRPRQGEDRRGQRLRHPTRDHRHQGRQLQQPQRLQANVVRHLPGPVHRAIRTDAEPVPARQTADLRQGPLPRIRPRRPTTRRPRSPIQGTRHRHRQTHLHHQRSPRTPQQTKTQGRKRARHPANVLIGGQTSPNDGQTESRGDAQLPANEPEKGQP